MQDFDKSNSLLLDEIQKLHLELAAIRSNAVERTTELYKSEERFSLAMRGANDGLWDWNLHTDEVFYSPRWKSMLGYAEHELEAEIKTWANLVHPDDKEWVLQEFRDYKNGRRDSFEVEMRMRHKDGREIFVLSRAFLVLRESDKTPLRLVGTHVDITDRKRAEGFEEKNSQILEMIGRGNPASEVFDAIALMYEERNPGMRCSMLELHGDTLSHGGAPSLPKAYCDAVDGLKVGPDVGSCGTSTYSGERVLVEDIETDPRWNKLKRFAIPHGMRCCWSEPIKDSNGQVLGAFGMYYDYPALPNDSELNDLYSAARLAGIVMERDHDHKRIRKLAFTDELTGLSSRAHFYQHLEDLIKTSNRRDQRFALLTIDLDDFKVVNDSLGHDVGDELLKTIGTRLKNTCREVDFVARLGGDEFCILVHEVDDEFAAIVAQRCLSSVSMSVELANRFHIPSCSIGIAHFPDDGDNLKAIIKSADSSLYAAKENGKNKYAFYDPEVTKKTEYRFRVERYLRQAIENQELSLVYQLQVNVATGEIIGVEALARWNHPELGEVSPIEFIPIAERIGMIKPLTEWVLGTACRQAVRWQQENFPAMRMAVNISPLLFLDKDIVHFIKRMISETGIEPGQLELEVTEGVVQTDKKNLETFKDLKDLGIQLAIDDFGTGYSSFASLKHLSVDCLKIDKYFIDDMIEDNEVSFLVSSMIEIGHKLGYSIIAEGVESIAQLHYLDKLGCGNVQGFLFSQPVDAESIKRKLGRRFVG